MSKQDFTHPSTGSLSNHTCGVGNIAWNTVAASPFARQVSVNSWQELPALLDRLQREPDDYINKLQVTVSGLPQHSGMGPHSQSLARAPVPSITSAYVSKPRSIHSSIASEPKVRCFCNRSERGQCISPESVAVLARCPTLILICTRSVNFGSRAPITCTRFGMQGTHQCFLCFSKPCAAVTVVGCL